MSIETSSSYFRYLWHMFSRENKKYICWQTVLYLDRLKRDKPSSQAKVSCLYCISYAPLVDDTNRYFHQFSIVFALSIRTDRPEQTVPTQSRRLRILRLIRINTVCQYITKTRLFKYTENFTTQKGKISNEKFWYFSYFCSKHRLWVIVRTASARRF